MPFLILFIGIILVVVAYQNTHGQLWSNLAQDLPNFFPWFLAIVAILGLGYLPGMKTPSRLLLALVAIVIVIKGWPTLQSQLQSFGQAAPAATGQGAITPSPESDVSGGGPGATPTPEQIAGLAPGGNQGVVGGSSGTSTAAGSGAPSVTTPSGSGFASMLTQNIPSPFNMISPSIGFGGSA